MEQLVEYYRNLDELISLEDLKSFLWGAATRPRGQIGAAGYKGYIFPLLFFKRISDMYDGRSEGYVCEGGIEYTNAQAQELVACIPDDAHWRDVRECTENVGQRLVEAFIAIEQANPGEHADGRVIGGLERIFGPKDDWTNKAKMPDHIITSLIEDSLRYNLSLKACPTDEMGQAYEYLVGELTDDAGNTALEFYTNRTVIDLVAGVLQPRPGENIYDPTCGSGGMLVKCLSSLRKKGEPWQGVRVFDQEINVPASVIVRMSFYPDGVEDFSIVREDTLAHPTFAGRSRLREFDIVLANPPYSIKTWNREAFMNDKWGRNLLGTPPQGRTDYTFFQHILVSVNDKTGRYAIFFPHGALSRGEEQSLREKPIKGDVVECVIGLGANLFYNSPMEACTLICNNQKRSTLKNKIIFINALKEVTRKNAESYLEKVHIEKIVSAYFNASEIQNFSTVAFSEQIANYNYSLSISSYVNTLNNENNFNVLSVSETLSNWKSVHVETTSSIIEMFTLIGR